MQTEQTNIKFNSNVLLKDANTGEVFVDKSNAVHPQNMARVIARGLANETNSNIHLVALGNGGTFIDTTGVIRFNNPNTTGTDAVLYSETYSEVVDGTVVNGNDIFSAASTTDITSIVTIEVTISPDEPSDQWLTDSTGVDTLSNPQDNSTAYQYEFDELGCFAINPLYDPLNPTIEPEFLLLTHIIFQPIAKSQNRQLQLTYTLTISVS